MGELILYLIPIVILGGIIVWLKTPKGIGTVGEWWVRLSLGKNVENKKYIVNNLVLTGENGRTSQIDHVLINKNGVFVIETKNYSGKIYGKSNELEWTQVLAWGKIKNKFYNPIKQNATHVYKLKEVIGKEIPIYSLIVFIRADIDSLQDNCVYDVKSMKKFIRKKKETVLTEEQIVNLYEVLNEKKKGNKVTNKQHISNIEKMKSDIENKICPRCNGELVEREGKSGKFYGCSNYPKCKFTKKM